MKMNNVGHKGVVSAVVTGLLDLFSRQDQLPPLDPGLRLDGKVALVTGANSGLGKAVAIDLARRGAHLLMVCRSGIPDAGEAVKQASGNPNVEMLQADLSDLASVAQLCDRMQARNIRLDIAVMNAGLMPLHARRTPQGHEVMFAVHFLANRLLMARWLEDGVIPRAANRTPSALPRVVFVSSEAHQSSPPIDFNRFAAFQDYGIKHGMKFYGLSKLHLTTFVQELERRVNGNGPPQVLFHSLCPGPIASNIARESPVYIKPILSPIMKLLFRSPEQAAEPVMLLACSPDMTEHSNVYLHMMKAKQPSPLALDALNGKQLWECSAPLIQPYLTANRRETECL
ncbi:SDR family NAD(P)-dependent oxidoreductase [Ketobacter sp.]|uniref:SDR family NAD(P)-dependent oxidoreductase n=1 Tax=Ketobacter sp. TaxID=2083498 RepID=UPI0025BF6E83|nr:SDR family NAD(P)-dependent oxidoreductase [Ketobacter sp.]